MLLIWKISIFFYDKKSGVRRGADAIFFRSHMPVFVTISALRARIDHC